MSLLLAGVVLLGTGGALAVGRWMQRGRTTDETRSSEKSDEATGDEESAARTNAANAPKPAARLDGFVCQLGDVVFRLTGEEAWLAGALVFSEEVDLAALFVAPDASADRFVYVRPQPKPAFYWLAPLDAGAVLVGGEASSAVEHDGVRYERLRRLPLRSRRLGAGAPDVGDSATVIEYASAGSDRLLVVKGSSGNVFAFAGIELDPGAFEVVASGESTMSSSG